MRLPPARRAFLEAATIHPPLWAHDAPHDFHAGPCTICWDSAMALIHAKLLEPIMQGDYTAELWDGTRLLGYCYRLTEAGRAAVATTEE